jgi:hypothetical protein
MEKPTKNRPKAAFADPSVNVWKLERAKGFEPSTPTLARLCSTPELHPRSAVPRHRCEAADLPQNEALGKGFFGGGFLRSFRWSA